MMIDNPTQDAPRRSLSLAWRSDQAKAVVELEAQVVGPAELEQEPAVQVLITGFQSGRWWAESGASAAATAVEDLPVLLRGQVAGLIGSTMVVRSAVFDHGLVTYIESPPGG